MSSMKNHAKMLEKLKKQVTALKRKEKATRKKLSTALARVKKIGKVYERKFDLKMKKAHNKAAAAEVAVYEKLAKAIKDKAKKVKTARKGGKASARKK